jgi:hypothetical protein
MESAAFPGLNESTFILHRFITDRQSQAARKSEKDLKNEPFTY